MITADDVDTLLFDVLGTVVDEAGSMRAELAAALAQVGVVGQVGAVGQAGSLAAAWARRFDALVSSIREGAPWRSTDDLNAEALADVPRNGPRRTLMVAAHPWDLRAAAAQGLRTAYIQRAGKGIPEPSDTFDLTVPDLAAFASRVLTEA